MPPDLANPVNRAGNLLASNATGALLALGEKTGDPLYHRALRRILDILGTQLADPDAAAAVDAIRRYRRATGDTRYDRAVRRARAEQGDAWGFESMGVDLAWRLERRPPGIGKRQDMLRWLEDGRPRRKNPALLALVAEMDRDSRLATRAVDIARTRFVLARKALPDGRDHGCAARTVSAVLRGHGRENHAGAATAVLTPILQTFGNGNRTEEPAMQQGDESNEH